MVLSMRRLSCLALLAGLVLFPSSSEAQRGRGGLRGRAAGVMAAVEDAGMLGTILVHKDDLKLTADQVTKIRQLDSATTAANAPTMAKVRALRADSATGTRPAEMTQEQRALALQRLQQAAPLLKEVSERNAKAADQAKALLSQEQKDALQKIIDEQAAGRGRGLRRRP